MKLILCLIILAFSKMFFSTILFQCALMYLMFFKVGLLKNFWNSDLLSLFLIILTIWVFFVGSLILINEEYFSNKKTMLLMVLFFLLALLMVMFLMNSILLFYVLFESVFLLMFLLIINWGYSPERLQSSFYMLFYTLAFSLPFLVIVFFQDILFKTFYYIFFLIFDIPFLEFIMLMVFLVKIPMYLFHLWLPKAHVEAPIFGSMVLAGVLLKIGGFGISRCLNLFCLSKKLFSSLLLFSSIMVSLCVLFQSDLKSMIAYSSVADMVLVLLGVFSFSFEGTIGMILLMITHGIISSSLFIVSFFLYSGMGSRSILSLENINMFSLLSFWFFVMMMLSLSLPLSSTFFSEMLTIFSSMYFWSLEVLLFIIILFLFGSYGIMMFFIMSMGGNKKLNEQPLLLKENLIFYMFGWPMIVTHFFMNHL